MSLYTAAKKTKLAINLTAVFLIMVVVGKIFVNLGYYIWQNLNPTPISPAEMAYGKLPKLKLNSLPLKQGSTPNYRLETIQAELPVVPDRAPVYKLDDSVSVLSSEKAAVNFAISLGFTEPRIEQSATDWIWRDEADDRTLEMNILTNDFHLETNLVKVAPTVPRGSAPNLDSAMATAKDFIASITSQNESYHLNEARLNAKYIQIKGTQVEEVDRQSEAQMVQVNFFIELPVDTKDYPGMSSRLIPGNYWIVTDNPNTGVVEMYLTNSTNSDYLKPTIHFSSQRLNLDNKKSKSTYPLKSINQAWQELKDGQAYIAHLRIKGDMSIGSYLPLGVKQVDITGIFLSYYDTGISFKKYLQPIYVFQGEAITTEDLRADYYAYVPAINPICWGEADTLGTPCSLTTQ